MGCGSSSQEPLLVSTPEPKRQQNPFLVSIPEPRLQLFSSLLSEDPELTRASELISKKQYQEASVILRSYLEKTNEDKIEKIDGLGQYDIGAGYYEWDPLGAYSQGVIKGKYQGTVYDVLSLCYCQLRFDRKVLREAQQWYQVQVDQHPENIGYLLGLANIFYNQTNYDIALEYYERVIDQKPTWSIPLECIACIFQHRIKNSQKSQETAKKLLALDPKNRVALFIMARNQKTSEQKIAKLKEVMEIHPDYAGAVNQIGLLHGESKKYEQAIRWYQRALEVSPKYKSCLNNIGYSYKQLGNASQAMKWFFWCLEVEKNSHQAYKSLAGIYNMTKSYIEDQIMKEVSNYKIPPGYFFLRLGHGFLQRGDLWQAQNYLQKAEGYAGELHKNMDQLYVLLAEVNIRQLRRGGGDENEGSFFEMLKGGYVRDAKQYLNKAIAANPENAVAYLNLGLVHKMEKDDKTARKFNLGLVNKMENDDETAMKYYWKAMQLDPYNPTTYNNIAAVYLKRGNIREAAKYFQKARENGSIHLVGIMKAAMIFLELKEYEKAFKLRRKAKQLYSKPKSRQGLTLDQSVDIHLLIEQMWYIQIKWENSPQSISLEENNKLSQLKSKFQSNFGKLYSSANSQIPKEKVLKKQIQEIVRVVHEDQFQLAQVDRVFDLIKAVFEEDQEYFHILPQLFMQYFYKKAFEHKQPVLDIERKLMEITKRLSAKTIQGIKTDTSAVPKSRQMPFKMKHFDPPKENKVNIFKINYFDSYAQIYSQIMKAHEVATKAFLHYNKFVQYISEQSHGELYGIGLKIPNKEQQQFKVILRIYEKMFKKELTQQKVESIIKNIDQNLRKQVQNNQKSISIRQVVHSIMETWTSEITEIVKDRKEKKIKTVCELSDLLRAKIMFESVDFLKKAVTAVDDMCHAKGYKVIEMDNRLAKQQTQDVVFKIEVKDTICELQLALKQDATQYHFTHSIYEIERSPLGAIFGSYIFMSKGFHYPFLENCKDIVSILQKENSDPKTLEAAKYIVAALLGESSQI